MKKMAKTIHIGFLVITLLGGAPAWAAFYQVTNANDAGPGSFREAVAEANASPTKDTIHFAKGLASIELLTGVALTQPVIIDGNQTIFLGQGADSGPGITVQANSCEIYGLEISGFHHGIVVNGASMTKIGTEGRGNRLVSNVGYGLHLVGNQAKVYHNLISGNGSDGVRVEGSNVIFEGNYIGTDSAGTSAFPNAGNGIFLTETSSQTYVGGMNAQARNVISGNSQNGLRVMGSAIILNNRIGTNSAGTDKLPNENGISLSATASGVVIGAPGGGNLISGNTSNGILSASTPGLLIQGNRIGTNASGTEAIANGRWGIEIHYNINHKVGGSGPGEGNLISGNSFGNVWLKGSGTIEGNYIGTNVGATAAIGGGRGILLNYWGSGSTVGGATPTAGNVISGNVGTAISVGARSTSILNNLIGTNGEGSASIPNGGGIAVSATDALDCIIGSPGAGNLISGNKGAGIYIAWAKNTIIQGNRIGTNKEGTAALPNSNGIHISTGAENTLIGGEALDEGNFVSGNRWAGIVALSRVTILNNYVGTDASGELALGNGSDGIRVYELGAIVGAPGSGNVISGNGEGGISGSNNLVVQGNKIGTSASGTSLLPNGQDGIFLYQPYWPLQLDTLIGGMASEGNVIAGSRGSGVLIFGNAHGVTIRRNSIYANTSMGISLGSIGPIRNDLMDLDTGSNNRQNHPQLGPLLEGSEVLQGTFHSAPNTDFILEVYRSSFRHVSKHGEGEHFVTDVEIRTDEEGNAAFTVELSAPANAGDVYTATATSLLSGDTSGFSHGVPVGRAAPEVTSILRAPGQDAITTDTLLSFAVSFTQPVTNLSQGDFELVLKDHGGASIQTVESVMKKAAAFDGSQNSGFVVPAEHAPNLTNRSFTVEAWARRHHSALGDQFFLSYGSSNSTNNRLHLGQLGPGMNGFSSRMAFAFWTSDVYSPFESWEGFTEWRHIAGTYDVETKTRCLYIDGLLVWKQEGGIEPLYGHGELHLGPNHVSGFDGALDEIRIWDHPRTREEIELHRFEPLSGTEAGLLAYYHFDRIVNIDGTLVLEDASGGGADAGAPISGFQLVDSGVYAQNYLVQVKAGRGSGSLGLAVRGDTSIHNDDYFLLAEGHSGGERIEWVQLPPNQGWSLY